MKALKAEPAPGVKADGRLSLWGPDLVQLSRAVFEKGGPLRFQATGFSMSPFIRNGDVITLFPLTADTIRLGDVVAFVSPGTERLVIHRVIARNGHTLFITGDNAAEADGPVARENILARVARVERKGKRVFWGLGPERLLIVFLTRTGLLFHLLLPLWQRLGPRLKRCLRG
ncbi:MAG: signal peptidase I [Thermodesulfobacteriota bacterium]|nr:signal peptidase I [Thermodesulfobacteriota bacterium]